jgi:hypothetical protein
MNVLFYMKTGPMHQYYLSFQSAVLVLEIWTTALSQVG